MPIALRGPVPPTSAHDSACTVPQRRRSLAHVNLTDLSQAVHSKVRRREMQDPFAPAPDVALDSLSAAGAPVGALRTLPGAAPATPVPAVTGRELVAWLEAHVREVHSHDEAVVLGRELMAVRVRASQPRAACTCPDAHLSPADTMLDARVSRA